MMKKRFFPLCAAALLSALILCGCGQKNEKNIKSIAQTDESESAIDKTSGTYDLSEISVPPVICECDDDYVSYGLNAEFDIDGDGEYETLIISEVTASVGASYAFTVNKDNSVKYQNTFVNLLPTVELCEKDGKTVLRHAVTPGTEHFHDIYVQNGRVVISPYGDETIRCIDAEDTNKIE